MQGAMEEEELNRIKSDHVMEEKGCEGLATLALCFEAKGRVHKKRTK